MTMNNDLDSRVLRRTDCYGQRFMREGRYGWAALPAGGKAIDDARPFSIEVGPRRTDGVMTQHDVVLVWRDKTFVTEAVKLVVEVGDLVVWHCGDANAPGWEVTGEQSFFGSDRLVNECGYSHAFGLPGRYEWVDAYGSSVRGAINVKQVDGKDPKALDRWRERIAQAALVMIQDGKVQAPEIDIVVGQRVYFAVVAGLGISVTDRRLLALQKASHQAMRTRAA